MTDGNCHTGIMGVLLNDNGSRRMLAGPGPLNGSSKFLKSFQVMSSHLFLNHALCNESTEYVGKKDGKSNQKEGEGQIGIDLGRRRPDWHR